jgi:hypothetical protein
VNKLINSTWNKEELSQQWKKHSIVTIYKRSDINVSNYIQNYIQYSLSSLTPYIDEIIGDNQCGSRRNRTCNDQIFCIQHTKKKNGDIVGQYIIHLYIWSRCMTQSVEKYRTIF